MNTCPRCGLPKMECEARRDHSGLACHLLNERCAMCGHTLRMCQSLKASPMLDCYLHNPAKEPVVAEDVQ